MTEEKINKMNEEMANFKRTETHIKGQVGILNQKQHNFE